MLDRSTQPIIQELHSLDIQHPERLTLSGGMPLYLLPDDTNEVLRVDMVFGGGRWLQQRLLQALFTNRMLREGTQRMDSAHIARQMDYYGGWLDLSVSYTHSFVTLYSLSRYLPQTLEVLRQLVAEATFPEHELEVVRQGNLQQYLVNKTKTRFQAQRLLLQGMMGGDYPAARVAAEDDYSLVDRSCLQEFYSQVYRSQNCTIYLSGKIGETEIKLFEQVFGQPFGLPGAAPQAPIFQPRPSDEARFYHEMPQAQQSSVFVGLPTIGRNHPDFQKMQAVVTLFGGYFGSRLMTNIREDKGYTYGISAGFVPYPEVNTLLISADCATQYVEPLLHEVEVEVDRLQTELVSDEELERVKHYMLGDICRNYDSAFSLADAWIMAHTAGLDDGYLARNVDAVRGINAAEVRRLAQQYLRRDQMKISVAGPQA